MDSQFPECSRTSADAARLSWLDMLVLVLALVLPAGVFAWFPRLQSPNELTRVDLTSALLEQRSVQLDQQLREHGGIFDLSVRAEGGAVHYYSDKAPGVALLSLPVIAAYRALSDAPTLEGKVRLTRLCVSTLPTLLLLVLLLRFLKRELRDPRLPALLVLAYALGSVATPYASMALGHQLSAVVLFSSFLAVRRMQPAAPWRWSLLVGACASLAVMVEYQNALLFLPLAAFFALRVRLRPAHLAAALLGAAPLLALLLAYHQAAFGSPFLTGYSFIASEFRAVHAQGLLGVALPKASHAFLSFVSPAKGLFFFAPWLAACVPGSWLLWRSRRDDLRLMLLFIVLYGLFVSALVYPVGGWTVSQRHLVPAVPFMLLPAGLCYAWLERKPGAGLLLLTGLALPSLLACGISAVVWPHYQENLQNPFWQLGWPLFLDGWIVPSVLNGLGIPSVALALVLLGSSALLMLTELALTARGALRIVYPLAALGIAVGGSALARLPGRTQDVTGDRSFIEQNYVLDPLAHPHRRSAPGAR
jgi:hypothetical protein